MRWLNKELPALLAISATSIPAIVLAAPAPHLEPNALAERQENGANAGATYNDGMYTPWTPEGAAAETAAPVATAATLPDNTVYLQPTTAPVEVTPATPIAETTPAIVATTSAIPTTPPAIPTTSSVQIITSEESSESSVMESSSVSASSNSASSSVSSRSSASSSVSSSVSRTSSSRTADGTASPFTEGSSTSDAKPIRVILPVALSIGALVILGAALALIVWRRRASKRRQLAARRYDDAFSEKGMVYDPPNGGDDDEDWEEKNPTNWQTFNRNSAYSTGPYDGVEGGGMAGRGVQSMHNQEQWSNAPLAPRAGRPPLPATPLQPGAPMMPAQHEDLSASQSAASLHRDLDNMIAQSRIGYAPYADRPQRQRSVQEMATSLYSTLSIRSKRSKRLADGAVAPRSGRANDNSVGGRWNETGAWQQLDDPEEGNESMNAQEMPASTAQDRPLLTAVDETPCKHRFGNNRVQPPSPTRVTPNGARSYATNMDDTDMTEAGDTSFSRESFNDEGRSPIRRFTLRNNPTPALSPMPKPLSRVESLARQYEDNIPDSPSIYSDSNCSSPVTHFPETLQPGRSPALGSRPVSPALPIHQQSALRQSSKSGTTYSLSGVAGLLYADKPPSMPSQPKQSSYTSMPPRKPRKQSVLSKYKPVVATNSPHSDDATAGETDAPPSPHRAISAVVRASRARGDSVGSRGSGESGHWNHRVRDQLRESHASSGSIDDLLTNVLGPTRSPA